MAQENAPDFIFITETWFTIEDHARLSGYNVLRADRENSVHGGVAIFYKSDYNVLLVESKSWGGFIELISVKIKVDVRDPILVILVYRSGNASMQDNQNLYNCLYDLTSIPIETILLGDFNFPSINWALETAGDNPSMEFLTLTQELSLHQLVTNATRLNNILDLVLSSNEFLILGVTVKDSFSESDHSSIRFSLNIETVEIPKSFRLYKSGDYEGMNDFIAGIDWCGLFSDCISIDDYWGVFSNILDHAISTYVPLVNRPKCKKLTPVVRETYMLKSKAYRKFKNIPSEASKTAYKNLSRNLRSVIRKDAVKSENEVLNSRSLTKFFDFVKSQINSVAKVPCIVSGGIDVYTPFDRACCFNSQFYSVFTRDNGILPDFPLQTTNELSDVVVSSDMVRSILKKLPNKTSCGPDNIPSIVLKNLADHINEPLAQIFRKSLNDGVLPKQWLISHITPIYKRKGPVNIPCNYRPISLTSTSSKVFETIIKNELVRFLDTNSLITTNQHGFRKDKSTVTNLLDILNNFTEALDSRKVVHSAYLDFAKAFDTVSHEKLFHKLKQFGIRGKLLKWFRSFLENRTQFVKIEGVLSDPKPIISGVPQGTILGPVLFIIFINDLVNCVKHCKISMYADDAKIYLVVGRGVGIADLLEDLNRVMDWANVWQLQLAVAKCVVLIIGSPDRVYEYSIGDLQLDSVTHYKDLGIIISSDLKSSLHCRAISKKAYFISSRIFKAFNCRGREFLVKMFCTFVRPILEYNSSLWSPCYLQDIDTVERVQRSFTKRIPGFQHLSYSDRLRILNLHSLEYRRIVFDLVLVYKILHGLINVEANNFFVYSTYHSTRSNNQKLKYPKWNLNAKKHFFTYRVIEIWNKLPCTTVNARTLTLFKNKLKSHDFSGYLRGRGVR